jgi:hypothetical protein
MDYMVELASHPDLLEAIGMETGTRAESLKKVAFLAEEHPNAWIAEVVHAFYEDPAFASKVWVNLRYCATFTPRLAEHTLGERAKRLKWRPRKRADKPGAPLEHVKRFKEDRRAAIEGYAAVLGRNRAEIDKLCAEQHTHPEPPGLLNDLITAEGIESDKRDARIRALLADLKQVRALAESLKVAVPFSMVQDGELQQIARTRVDVRAAPPPAPEPPARHSARKALEMNLLGLAFSGGGIRSATFNLGVMQALSKGGLLKYCDYLSTVSGGGYIGTWLAGWIRRELDEQQKRDGGQLQPGIGARVTAEIQRRLSPTRYPNPMDERVRPIRFLREYSNYLTPRAGFLSADTWTMLGIYVRNTLLNQVIIVSLFAALLLMPRNWFWASAGVSGWVSSIVLAVGFWLVGAVLLSLNLRRLDPRDEERIVQDDPAAASTRGVELPWYAQPRVIQLLVVLPWLLAAALVARPLGEWAFWGAGVFAGGAAVPTVPPDAPHLLAATLWIGGIVGVSLFTILGFGGTWRCWRSEEPNGVLKGWGAIALGASVAGVVAAGLAWVLFSLVLQRASAGPTELAWHLNAIVTPGLLSVLSLAIVAMLGMLGERFPDEHREWWSRLRTFIHIYAAAWLMWFVVTLYVPWGVDALSAKDFGWKSGLAALGTWLGATIFGVKKGPQAESARKERAEATTAAPKLSATTLRYAALVAPYVFVVGLVLALSLGIDALYRHNLSHKPNAYWEYANETASVWCLLWTVGCALVGVLFSWRVNINEFSIHHFYKNRLVRCYLGASHTADRKADWFTGFDPKDDLCLSRFDHTSAKDAARYPGPYPILNCALNLVGGQDLAWQERKATSFVFTPKHCGYDVDRAVLTKRSRKLRSQAYVPTKSFYQPGQGPLLGMAMAISGAAANPNMGRASSPALAFLMTVFNVRLGWWIGNPRNPKGIGKAGPRFGLAYTAMELFGASDDTSRFVNLSDGGHFDNLGVYELIRRSCRYIIVCDAGQDSRFICEDLGNLVRRCRTDFGVEIDIALDRIRDRDPAGISQTHCVVGKIHYLNLPRRNASDQTLATEDDRPLQPGCRPAHEIGYLVYLKPSITGDEPQDVLEYYRRIPEFPHQSTADQWFGESQFESYRKLGMHIGEETFSRYQDDDTASIGNLGELFERLYMYWYPPSVAINQRSTEHTAEYSRIMELVRNQERLRGLDHTMFDGLDSPGEGMARRDEFYVCNALIQLMENVYADLDLEHNWDHPHVRGWMRVFKRWAQQPAFGSTWQISESTYAERFRNFYNDRLCGGRSSNGRAGEEPVVTPPISRSPLNR